MLENLNAEQKKAVETTDGPLLVLSGAGTGKTRVLTTRIAYILERGLAAPWQIMALTFTNRAANEMKTRIASFATDGNGWYAGDLWCGTFHSVCLRILRANAPALGMRRDFIIYGEDDQKTILKTIFSNMGLDAKDFNPSDWIERISAIKDKGLHRPAPSSGIGGKIFDTYNAELARLGAVDFGDIILKVLELFENNPEILSRYQNQFKYILVDEFQDTNNAQMQFLGFLTRDIENPNICCVGDDDQSIYSWRGAEIKHILNFDKTYPNAQIIRLETNYRSTANILGAANSLIRHNCGRLGKDLRSATADEMGEPVYVLTVPTDWDEARIVADTIARKDTRESFSNYSILIRAASVSRVFEEEFATRGIPYKLVGTTKFYDRAEIRDAIAYLRLLVYPFDDLSFLRAISKPRRGFGAVALGKLRGMPGGMMAGLRNGQLTARQRAAADEFLSAFDFDWDSMRPADAAQHLLDVSGYIKMWRESKDTDAPERIEHIRDLITNVISKYDTMVDFLEHAALMMTDDNDANEDNATDAVNIMTIHAAKGLEFDTVFLPAWEEGIFPNDKAINEGALEEERRLAYVAITRARRRAIIINAMSRMVFGERKYNSPSRFITEMDSRFLDFQGGTVVARPAYHAPTPPHPVASQPAQGPKSLAGQLCSHAELGRGVVIEENGDIITVAFRSRGIKKVARDYLRIGA